MWKKYVFQKKKRNAIPFFFYYLSTSTFFFSHFVFKSFALSQFNIDSRYAKRMNINTSSFNLLDESDATVIKYKFLNFMRTEQK